MSEYARPKTIKWLMREPLVHFFLMALIIFAVYGLRNRTQTVLLELDQADIEGRLFMQEMATGQALTEEQRAASVRFLLACRLSSLDDARS